jgi:hypothetical protein
LSSEQDTTQCTSSIDLPLLEYQCDLSIHEAFVVAAEKQLINEAVNNCTMMTLSERENLIQVALADAVKECLEKAQAILSDSAKSVKEEIKGKSDLEVGEGVDVGQQILVNVGPRKMRNRWTCGSPRHSNL